MIRSIFNCIIDIYFVHLCPSFYYDEDIDKYVVFHRYT